MVSASKIQLSLLQATSFISTEKKLFIVDYKLAIKAVNCFMTLLQLLGIKIEPKHNYSISCFLTKAIFRRKCLRQVNLIKNLPKFRKNVGF